MALLIVAWALLFPLHARLVECLLFFWFIGEFRNHSILSVKYSAKNSLSYGFWVLRLSILRLVLDLKKVNECGTYWQNSIAGTSSEYDYDGDYYQHYQLGLTKTWPLRC